MLMTGDGLALKVEDCPRGETLLAQIKSKVDQARRFKPVRFALKGAIIKSR